MIHFQKEFVAFICSKKELAALDEDYVVQQIQEVFLSEHLTLKKFNDQAQKYSSFDKFKRSALCKKILSLTRKKLRIAYGVYIKKPLKSFKKNIAKITSPTDDRISHLLEAHQSSQERFSVYKNIYKNIFDALKEFDFPSSYSLLDLACGYNPFSYHYFPIKPTSYLAVDLSSEDMSLINDFFKVTNISGQAYAYSLLSEEFFEWYTQQKPTLCFFLKTMDSIEQKKRHYSKTLLSSCPAPFVVVSFPLISIGGKPLDADLRSWFTRFIEKEKWEYKTFSQANELFYIIKK